MSDSEFIDEKVQYFLEQSFEMLRIAYKQRELDLDDAIEIHQKLIDRLGIEDPAGTLEENPPWVRSSWCLGG